MILGILFPYSAIRLSTYSLLFLVVLMLSSGMAVEWGQVRKLSARLRDIGIGLIAAYGLFPVLLWITAGALLEDQQFLYGFVFSTLCPIAMVAPYFSRLHSGDAELAMLLVLVSMLLCPLLIPIVLTFGFSTSVSLNLVPLTRYMLLLIIVPMALGGLIAVFLPRVRQWIGRLEAPINSLMLGLLMFALFGTAVGKLNMSYTPVFEIASLLFLVLLQDFGVLFATRFLVGKRVGKGTGTALMVSLCMKNVAIAAGVLLVYDPRASFAPALALFAHAILFTFLSLTRWSSRIFART
jgi:bile acid:Na+ symporter, BASS family